MVLVAPQRRAWGATALLSTTSVTVTPPPGAAAGDLLVFAVTGADPSATTITPPAGVHTVLGRTSFGTRIAYVFAAVCSSATQSFTFALSSAASVHVATMAIRTTSSPASLTVGPVWKRPGSSNQIKAEAVSVPEAGALVLGLLFEASSANEKETDVSSSGLARWFFSRQTAGSETVAAHFSDASAVGLTSEVNATYLNASQNGMGVQLVVPAAPGGATPPPTASYATITQQTYNSLRVGAKTTDAATVTAVARPVGGGTPVTMSPVVPPPSGWVSVKVDGLTAGQDYDVELISAGQVLATARGTTLTPERAPFVVLTGSCQANNSDPLVFDRMRAEGAAFFVHQGDLHYRDTQDETTWRAGVDLALSTPRMRAFIASTPLTWRWDNHDWGGSLTWRESPIGAFAPDAFRELFGTDFPHPRATYQTWVHRGVRFVDTDQWTMRDQALTTPSTDATPGKSMWGLEQRTWFFQTLLAATEPLIVWFPSFPLYSNRIGNGRWGNYLDEVAIIDAFLDEHPEIRARLVAVGGDSHSVCADDGTNTMWHVPSLNASPFAQAGGLASGTWNIANLDVDDARGYYSRLSFDWTADDVELTWDAVQDDGAVMATWSRAFPIDWGEAPAPPGAGLGAVAGGREVPAQLSVVRGGREVPALSLSRVP
ncbi:metallophosphoesterase family protein [Cellulosimicrobium funkei]|uniref:hypothetical protein n=1 Tax=Cellulosimicrobium funkei TaxID=264251 RepID=UPI003678B7AC